MALRDQLRVLVVDDMSVSRGLLTQALDQLGVRNYATASSGAEAIAYLQRTPVHLVVSDYNMPGMDGLELLQQLRASAATARTGFIMVTGTEDRNVIQRGAALGMNNYLPKPFSAATVRDCIEKVFGRL